MTDEESFSAVELREDIASLEKIAERWRGKMEYLPANQEFAMFRRAVTKMEKASDIAEKIIERFYAEEV